MKKKGSFLSGLFVFILIIIILGGVGYLGFNVIKNANGMAGMNMASDTTSSNTSNKETAGKESTKGTSDITSSDAGKQNSSESTYKINQTNQIMINKETLDSAYETIHTALQKMTLDPYAKDTDPSSSMNNQMNGQMNDQSKSNSDSSKSDTTVTIYNGNVTSGQSSSIQSMGQTYDASKMQQLHSGLYKVSVGIQLLKQLQDNVTTQMEQANTDTSNEAQYYLNQYNDTIQNKSNLNEAMNYINDAVDLININPYIDANGVVYDQQKMTQLHDSIYQIAQGVVTLNKLNNELLAQSLKLGTLAQNAYNTLQTSGNSMNMTSNMSTGINASNIITIVMIAFVVIFIICLLGCMINLFKPKNQNNDFNQSLD